MAQNDAAKTLNDLIATCHDAEEGYAKAAKGVHDRGISDRLTEISGRRAGFAEELSQIVSEMGLKAATDAHYGGILHKGWVDLETRLRSKNDHDILRECRRGDETTVQHYDRALEGDLEGRVRAVVERQRQAVLSDLSTLENFDTSAKKQHA